jgi:hypothetical protein
MPCDHRQALALARQGEWARAHELVRSHSDPLSCLIHGYLHRVEGDADNAAYWYGQAHSAMPEHTVEEEWQRLSALIEEYAR